MPRLSQWLIRLAFGYLLLGFTFGALLLAHKGVPLHPLLWAWLPAHIEFLLFGWIVQFTFAAAYWLLPRFRSGPRRPYPNYALGGAILLNAGIWFVVAGTTLRAGWGWLLAGRIAELAAVLLFGRHIWARIVGRDG